MAQDPSTLVNSKIAGIYGCSKKIWYDSSDMIGFDPDPHGQVHQKDAPHQGSWRDHRICAWCLTSWRRDGRNHTHPSPGPGLFLRLGASKTHLMGTYGMVSRKKMGNWEEPKICGSLVLKTSENVDPWRLKSTSPHASIISHCKANRINNIYDMSTSNGCVGKGGMLPNHHFNRGKCADSNPLEMGAQSVFKQLRSRGASASARHHVSLLAHLMQQRLVWKVKLAVSKWKLPATQLISAKIWRK
jgi:hypothetical protein